MAIDKHKPITDQGSAKPSSQEALKSQSVKLVPKSQISWRENSELNKLSSSNMLKAFYERTQLNTNVSITKTISSESLASESTVVSDYSESNTELSTAETVPLYDADTSTKSSEKPRFPFFVLIHGLFLQQKENGNYEDYRLKRDQYEESAEKIKIAENEGKDIPYSLQSDHKKNKRNLSLFKNSENYDDLKLTFALEKLLEEGGENELRFILSLFDEFSTKYPEINESRLIFLVEREYVIDALEKQKILPTPESNDFLDQQAELKQKFSGAKTYKLPDHRAKKSASNSFDWSSFSFLFVAAFITAIASLFSLFAGQKNEKDEPPSPRPH